jgi:hypothetical protein
MGNIFFVTFCASVTFVTGIFATPVFLHFYFLVKFVNVCVLLQFFLYPLVF